MKLFKHTKTAVLSLVAITAIAFALTGCGNDKPAASKEAPQKILRVGSETTFPPFEFSENDKYVGFDVDLSEALAKQMGYKMEFKSMGFDALIPALRSGDIDMIAAGLDPTEERKKVVNFSDIYFETDGYALIVNKNNPNIKTFDDLQGKKIAAQIGTVPADIAKAIPNTTTKEVDSNSQLFMELTAGTVDAIILDSAVARYYLKQGADKDLQFVDHTKEVRGSALAVSKDNPELLKQVNAALAELRKNGEYDKIYKKWFGEQPKK